jgi:hypothetical protein
VIPARFGGAIQNLSRSKTGLQGQIVCGHRAAENDTIDDRDRRVATFQSSGKRLKWPNGK